MRLPAIDTPTPPTYEAMPTTSTQRRHIAEALTRLDPLGQESNLSVPIAWSTFAEESTGRYQQRRVVIATLRFCCPKRREPWQPFTRSRAVAARMQSVAGLGHRASHSSTIVSVGDSESR
jgi:hypothetical protein